MSFAADGEGAGAGGDDADEALRIVARDRTAEVTLADAEAGGALAADEGVLVGIGAEGAGATGRAKGFGEDAGCRPRFEVKYIEAELEAAVHEARTFRERVAAAFELEAHNEIAGLHDLGEQQAGTEGVGHAAGHDEGVADMDGDFVEAGLEAGDVLGLDQAAQLVARGRALETEVEKGWVREIVADREDVVGLGFSGRRVEKFLGERGGGMDLKVEADRRVEELDEKLGRRAVAGDVRGAEVRDGIGREEIGEVTGSRIGAEENRGETLGEGKVRVESWERRVRSGGVAGGVGGIDRAGGGGDPVLGEMGVGGRGGAGKPVQFAAAEVSAPNAVRGKPEEWSLR